jgi:hypothetical protein
MMEPGNSIGHRETNMQGIDINNTESRAMQVATVAFAPS